MKLDINIIEYILEEIENQIYFEQFPDKFIESHVNNKQYKMKQEINKLTYSFNELAYHLHLMNDQGLFLTESVDDYAYFNDTSISNSGMITAASDPNSIFTQTSVRRSEFISREKKVMPKNNGNILMHNILGLSNDGHILLQALRDDTIKKKITDKIKNLGNTILPIIFNIALMSL